MAVGGDVGGALGDLGGGIIGDLIAQGDYEQAEKLLKEAAGLYDNVQMPGQAQQMGDSAFAGLAAEDGELRNARLTALRRMQQVGMEGGLDAESRAAMAEAQFSNAQMEGSQRGALMQRAAERGGSSSGLMMGAQLAAQQGAAQRNAMAGTQAAADARRRALQALASSEGMARGMSQDDYQRQRDRAAAMDAAQRFNTGLRAQFDQQRFGNQMDLQGARYGATQDEAAMYDERGRRKAEKARGYGRAAGTLIGTGAQAAAGGGI